MIRIIYYNPVWRSVIEERPELMEPSAHELDDCQFLVYETMPDPEAVGRIA